MLKKQIKAGIVLIETMLAIAMLAIGVVIAGQYLNMAIESQVLSRDYLIANNLADEGVEIVKAVRNTNWLQHPNTADLWLDVEPFNDLKNSITDNNSTSNFIPNILPVISLTNDTDHNDNLDLINYDSSYNALFRLFNCPADGLLYMPNSNSECSNPSTSVATKFYRNITFQYVDNTMATFTVKVQWQSINGVETLERTETIFNK